MNTPSPQKWFSELVAVVASAPELSELTGFTVSFVVDGQVYALDLARRVPTDGAQASCHLFGGDEVFERLVRGQTTLQYAYLSGDLGMTGDPQTLFRLAYLFERSSSAFAN